MKSGRSGWMEEADRKWMGFTIKFSGSLTVYMLHGFPVD